MPTHCLLKGGTGSSSAVHFSIEKANIDELTRQCQNMRTHDIWSVRPGEGPDDVAGSVADMRAHTVVAQVDIVDESFF